MTTKKARKSIDELIADAEAKLKELHNRKNSVKETFELNKDSSGMTELISAFDAVVQGNKVKASDVIRAIAKIKRIRIEIPARGKSVDQSL